LKSIENNVLFFTFVLIMFDLLTKHSFSLVFHCGVCLQVENQNIKISEVYIGSSFQRVISAGFKLNALFALCTLPAASVRIGCRFGLMEAHGG
jgi:hypothetical protein